MESVVVDSSVAIKWFVQQPCSNEAHLVLDQYRSGSLQLLVPDLLYAEYGNIVWKKHRLQGLVAADATAIIPALQTLPLSITVTSSLPTDAYHLAAAHQRTVYDMMNVALSVREQCRLVTADE